MARWRKLHKLTYVVAIGLLVHLFLAGEAGLTGLAILVALATRAPAIRNRLEAFGKRGQRPSAVDRRYVGI